MTIKKILIANRGEIARRIIRTAHTLDIQCVAIYSNADKHGLHVSDADFSHALNSDVPSESYLNIPLIIAIAQQHACQAIHPGYGFLAENAHFARACEQAGLIFIGPAADTIELMGDKAAAKAFCKQHHIPVIPGEENLEQNFETFKVAAEKTGYPLLVKASAGGGGKGMKLVQSPETLEEAFYSAKREALKAFNDDTLLIERYFEQARHVEVQILADSHGNVIHLFDRDCSLQRRHQKIIEEAPAFGLKAQTRQAMYDCALRLCQLIRYRSAATLEFLVDENEQFYLMEMNTRLQVEHAVSEQITGIDIVEQQILIAEGKPLKLKQGDIQAQGHAIEARLYAEQCHNNFLPASGLLKTFLFPKQTSALRIDHALKSNMEITSLYDPMIAKVSCWSETREQAIQALDKALAHCCLLGIDNNRDFLRKTLQHKAFIEEKVSTRLIEQNQTELCGINAATESDFCLAKNLFLLAQKTLEHHKAHANNQAHSPWYSADYWRIFSNHEHHFLIKQANQIQETQLLPVFDIDQFEVLEIHNNSIVAKFSHHHTAGLLHYHALKNQNAIAQLLLAFTEQHALYTFCNTETGKVLGKQSSNLDYLAPLNGKVVSVHVKQGDAVEAHQALAVLEAMKMEHIIKARDNGIIEQVTIADGDQVTADQLLFRLATVDKHD